MATSDSEAYESADEDLITNDIAGCNGNDMKPICDPFTNLHDENRNSNGNKCENDTTSILSEFGNLTFSEQELAYEPSKKVEKPKDRRQRPARSKEPKSTGPRKLGTKLLNMKYSETDAAHVSNAPSETDSTEASDLNRFNIPEEDSIVIQEKTHVTEGTSSEKSFTGLCDKIVDSGNKKESSGWGGWNNWGVSSLLSSASESVSSITSQVTQGLSSVLEAGIGAPSPEDLANRKQNFGNSMENTPQEIIEYTNRTDPSSEHGTTFGLKKVISGVSTITKFVEVTSSKVLTGGLDTLETIGKKTMEVLQEGDPGLKKKRALLTEKTSVLSQFLREAKEKAELEEIDFSEKEMAKRVHFETLFDDHQGLVHLEAIEMLSKQAEMKIQSVLLQKNGSELLEVQGKLAEIKALCQLPDDEDSEEELFGLSEQWEKQISDICKPSNIPFSTFKLLKTWTETNSWLNECETVLNKIEETSEKFREIHQQTMTTLAHFTAEAVEQFHKCAELLLVKEARCPKEEAEALLQVTSILSSLISYIATRYSEKMNSIASNDENGASVNELITKIFLEASNASSYIQEAFQLLIPVLQISILV